jgi:hypothetical protein
LTFIEDGLNNEELKTFKASQANEKKSPGTASLIVQIEYKACEAAASKSIELAPVHPKNVPIMHNYSCLTNTQVCIKSSNTINIQKINTKFKKTNERKY